MLCALAPATLPAGELYKRTGADGIVHYSGAPPADATDVTALRWSAEPGLIARMRITREDDASLVWADNTLAGPVQVRVSFARSNNVHGEPELPARATVPARGSVLVTRLFNTNTHADGSFSLAMDATPGPPTTRPRDVEYQFPLATTDVRIEQGYGGRFSHADPQNHYAVDFAAPIGTEVLAARDGVVMQVESDFDRAGLNLEKYGGRANLVRILHDDGTMALYAHLRENGVMVQPGQRVRAGQPIGRAGNTGFTSGPHLHFVLQVNQNMQLVSIPFRMFGPGGLLRFSDNAATPAAAGR